MTPLMRIAIILAVAWIAGLVLVVATLIRKRPLRSIVRDLHHQFVFPEEIDLKWFGRAVQKVGTSATTVAIGLAFIVLVAFLVSPLLPPQASATAARIAKLEQWKAAHDSIHQNDRR